MNFLLILIFILGKVFVSCEDEVEEEMEDDDEAVVDDGTNSQVEETGEEEEADSGMKGSPDVDTVILFTKPNGEGKGKAIHFKFLIILGILVLTSPHVKGIRIVIVC